MRTYHPNPGSKFVLALVGSESWAEAGIDSIKSLAILSLGAIAFSILFALTSGLDLSPGLF